MTPPDIALTPVGVVHNQLMDVIWSPDGMNDSWRARALRGKASLAAVSTIEVDPALDGILDGTEEFSHLLVLWWPDRRLSGLEKRTRVRPMGRQDMPEVGIFATRSPVRPNPVLATVVKLVARRGNVLEVTGLDAIDGTPVIDIKPVTPSDCPGEELRVPEWMDRIGRDHAALDDEEGAATAP